MQQQQTKGFTIVEMLIVIVVIGILAAITIVAYNGVQARAYDMVIRSDFNSIAKKIEIWKVDNTSYPMANQLLGVGIKASKPNYLTNNTKNNFFYCVKPDGSQYSFGAISSSNQGYVMTSSGSITNPAVDATDYYYTVCAAIGESGTSGARGYFVQNGAGAWQSWAG
jgi:type II secretion system protein G